MAWDGDLMSPPVIKHDNMQTGQCGASVGETSQIWQKKAVPRPLCNVYFGVKVNKMPKRRLGSRFGASWLIDVTGSSRPHFKTSVNDFGVNWLKAPKRSMAWKPSTTAALNSNHRLEGGRK